VSWRCGLILINIANRKLNFDKADVTPLLKMLIFEGPKNIYGNCRVSENPEMHTNLAGKSSMLSFFTGAESW
jgi:hypothetical protein